MRACRGLHCGKHSSSGVPENGGNDLAIRNLALPKHCNFDRKLFFFEVPNVSWKLRFAYKRLES